MNVKFVIIIFSCSLNLFAQDQYASKTGQRTIKIPVELSDVYTSGPIDIAIRNDTAFFLEASRIHVVPFNPALSDKKTEIPVKKDERVYALVPLKKDVVGVVVGNGNRSICLLQISYQTGIVTSRIENKREALFRRSQSVAFFDGKVFIPVSAYQEDAQPALWIVSLIDTSKQEMVTQNSFFYNPRVEKADADCFCKNTLVFTKKQEKTTEILILNSGNKNTMHIEHTGEMLDVPFKIDCDKKTLWCWEVQNDSLLIKGIDLKRFLR